LLGFLSFFLTYLIINSEKKEKMMAVPNERSLHDKPTPTGGGIAIVCSWYIGITILYFSGLLEKSIYLGLLCGILLAIVT
jgi:Fuc2NAc and GlcNAc transferase